MPVPVLAIEWSAHELSASALPLGEFAALSCSFLWALCSLAFASAARRAGPTGVNQLRIYVALLVLLALHAVSTGTLWPSDLSPRQNILLAVSGLCGLALGDLCLFHCMAAIGPRLGTLLMASSPAMAVSIGWFALDETLGLQALAGIAVVIVSVVAVLFDARGREGWRAAATARLGIWPVVLGLLGALGQALGLILARDAMLGSAEGELQLEPLSATVVRMTAGAVGGAVLGALSGRLAAPLRVLRDGRALRATLIGTLFGPVLGVWMSAVAVRHAETGIASTLMSLAPVVMIPLARIAYGARPGRLGVLGSLTAAAGAALLFLRG